MDYSTTCLKIDKENSHITPQIKACHGILRAWIVQGLNIRLTPLRPGSISDVSMW